MSVAAYAVQLVPRHSDFDWLNKTGPRLPTPVSSAPVHWFNSCPGSISKSQNHCVEVLALTAPMRESAAKTADISRMAGWAGQSVALARRESAGNAVQRIWSEAETLLP